MAPSEKKLAKKADKFTSLLGRRLKDGEWNGKRKKLKKLFQRAIKRLPEDELKNKLNTELPKYLKTLEENVLGTSTKPVLKEVKSNDLPATHAKKAKKNKLTPEDEPKQAKKRKKVTAQVEDVSPYNLYVNKADKLDTERLSGNERNEAGRCYLGQTVTSLDPKKIDKLLKDVFEGGEDWARESETLCEVITGDQRPLSLKQAMLHLNRVLADQSEAIMQLKTKKLKAAIETLKKLLMFFHLKWSTLEQKFTNPPYADLMAALLSMYADMVVTLSRTVDEEERDVLVRHLLMTSVLLVQPEYLCDVILQQAAVEIQDVQALLPFWRYALLTPRNISVPAVYTKYMCALRHVLPNIEGQEKDDFLKVALSIVPPTNYLSWLLDLDPAVLDDTPLTTASPGGAVTRHLVEEASEDFMETLLNLLTAEVTDLEEQTVAVSEETPSTSDAAPLFFIDKTATGQTAEGEKTAEEKDEEETEGYTFTEADVDRELALNFEGSGSEDEVSEGSADEADEEGKDLEMETESKDGKEEESDGSSEEVEEEKNTKNEEAGAEEENKSEEGDENEEEEERDEPKNGRDFIDLEAEEEEHPLDDEDSDDDNFINDESEKEDSESESEDDAIEIGSEEEHEENDVIRQDTPKTKRGSTIVIESDEEQGKDDVVPQEKPKAKRRSAIVIESDEEVSSTDSEVAIIKETFKELDEGSTESELMMETGGEKETVKPKSPARDRLKTRGTPAVSPLTVDSTPVVIEEDSESETSSIESIIETRLITQKKIESKAPPAKGTRSRGSSLSESTAPSCGAAASPRARVAISPRAKIMKESPLASGQSPKSRIHTQADIIEVTSPKSKVRKSPKAQGVQQGSPVKSTEGKSPKKQATSSPHFTKVKRRSVTSEVDENGGPTEETITSPKRKAILSPKSPKNKTAEIKEKTPVSPEKTVKTKSPKRVDLDTPKVAEKPKSSVTSEVDENGGPTEETLTSPKRKAILSPKSPKNKTAEIKEKTPVSPEKKVKTKSPKQTDLDTPKVGEKPKRAGRKSLARLEMTPGPQDEDALISPRHTRTGRILDSPAGAKTTPRTTRDQTPKSDKPTSAVASRRRSALGIPKKDVYDFTSDIETPVPLKGSKPTKRVADAKASEVSVGTPKKTRAAQLVEEEVGTPRRRSRRLSTSSLGEPEAETTSQPAASNPRATAQKDVATPRPGTPVTQTRAPRRKSVLPVLNEDQSSPVTKVSPKRLPSAEKRKPATRRRSMLLSQAAESPSVKSPAGSAKKSVQ